MRARVALLLLALLAAASAPAHEIRPGFLRIREVAPAAYDMFWKTPAQGNMRLALDVVPPAECRNATEPHTMPVAAAVIQRWRMVCTGGLPGKALAIANLATSLTDVVVRFEPLNGAAKTLRVNGANPSFTIPERATPRATAEIYFRLGVEHILTGLDHLLFVLCLVLLVGDFKRLLGAVTAFTAAHTLSLAATSYGWIRLAAAPVEACIALSIAFLAAEVLHARAGKTSVTQRRPWLVAFGFGLLHGLGVAAALRAVGLPEDAMALALLAFNLGVEAAQVLFIAAVVSLLFVCRRHAGRATEQAARVAAYAAGVAACFWFIERTVRMAL